jgi:tRNA-(ms[2]io[6]A)-hydroxylase
VRAFPDDVDPDRWVARLTAVARDEVDHLAEVNRQLAKRGGRLSRGHHNDYARALRREVASGTEQELTDRLHVSALIELRSFERFRLLAGAGHELSGLYAELEASEAGHYRLFLQLARSVGGTPERWQAWLAIEGEVARVQEPGSRIHAGVRSLGADDEETVA